MSLSAGDRLGSYEVLGAIGAGGMGEVYRGRDTRLDRPVAIKVLPDAVARDPERLARFEREAKTLAALNHPNIAQIYGLEGQALVMEYVDGVDLSTRIAQGPVPVDDAVAIARQIAHALEAAHELGIIHRDLKPSNIRIRPDGEVKVLDFGLAKALAPASALAAYSSPTITSPAMTQLGVVLGTAAYMSPEQARGKPVDKRADIWAFGAVLYEMTTGRRPFDGETVTESLAAVMKSEPDWAPVPPTLRRLLRSCLDKDPKRRLRDIGDWERQLDDGAGAVAPVTRAGSSWLLWIAIAALATAGGALAFVHFSESAPAAQQVSFQIHPPPKQLMGSGLAMSADGRRVGFIARSEDGVNRVWVRDLDAVDARPVAGTEGAQSLFWSPDGESVGFLAGRALKRAGVAGGPVLTLFEAVSADAVGAGSWTRDGAIIFGGTRAGVIRRVSESGGAVTPVTALNKSRRDLVHGIPHVLPDGRHFLYTNVSADSEVSGTYLGALDRTPGDQPAARLVSASMAKYSESRQGDGYLLYLTKSTLMAHRFDLPTLALVGDPVAVAEGVGNVGAYGFFTAGSAHLAYRTGARGGSGTHAQLVWTTRDGTPKGVAANPAPYDTIAVSPDGSRAAVVLAGLADAGLGNIDIWVVDLTRGVSQRLTTEAGADRGPVWSPDQSRVAFYAAREGKTSLRRRLANGAGAEETLFASDRLTVATSWSSDNRFLLFQQSGSPTGFDIWVLPLSGNATPVPIVQTPFVEGDARFSPDTRWIAYTSNSSDRSEIYVRPFDSASPGSTLAAAVRVSNDGGRLPRWTRNGRELVFQGLDDSIMAVEVSADGRPGTPKRLFALPGMYWDVTADGNRFLVTAPLPESGTTPITVLLNWASRLPK